MANKTALTAFVCVHHFRKSIKITARKQRESNLNTPSNRRASSRSQVRALLTGQPSFDINLAGCEARTSSCNVRPHTSARDKRARKYHFAILNRNQLQYFAFINAKAMHRCVEVDGNILSNTSYKFER
ncbi:hypothetical protein ABG067_001086 [Albugo candida]